MDRKLDREIKSLIKKRIERNHPDEPQKKIEQILARIKEIDEAIRTR